MKTKIALAGLIAVGSLAIAPAAFAAAPAPAAPAPAPAAPAAPAPAADYCHIEGPATAKAGEQFRITGKCDKGLAGSKVTAYQNGKKFDATRTVSSNGDISMRIVSGIKGKNTFQFKVVDGAGNVWPSNVITIAVR